MFTFASHLLLRLPSFAYPIPIAVLFYFLLQLGNYSISRRPLEALQFASLVL